MTAFFRGPFWVTINYHNARAPHKMTYPIRQWSEPSAGHDQGYIVNWNDIGIDANDEVNDYVDLLVPIFTDETTFDDFTIYRQLTADDIPEPIAAAALTQVGTSVGLVVPAAQSTWTYRTADLHHAKFVYLDLPVPVDFGKTHYGDLPAEGLAIVAYITDADHGFSGRDGSRPATFISSTATLNEKLRRAYRFT